MKKYSLIVIAAMAMLTMACKKNHDVVNNPSGKKKQLLSDTYYNGTTTYSYDAAGKLSEELLTFPNGETLKYVNEYTASAVTRKAYENGKHTSTHVLFLDNGKAISAKRYGFNAQGDTTLKLDILLFYDAQGRLEKWDYQNGHTTVYLYNADGDVETIEYRDALPLPWRTDKIEYYNKEDKNWTNNRFLYWGRNGEYFKPLMKHVIKRITSQDRNTPAPWSDMNFTYEFDNDGYVIKGTRKDVGSSPSEKTWTNTWTN